ncbi:tRNA CCA-pyrophosphorylase [Nanoarchaeota archaeon]
MDFEKILKEIKPSEEERKKVFNIINEFFDILRKNNLEPFLGGSFAKDTWLKNDFDVDTFILFDKDNNISNKVEEVLKKEGLNYIRIKGSRDYFRVSYKGLIFELVPILKIKNIEEAKNTTDLSPFHVKYVLSKISNGMNDEIRLLKLFMKNIGVYGAESYVRGFSGYATELLIIYYKSFINTIKNIVNWKPKVIIDIEGYYKNYEEIKKSLSKDKIRSPIIIIDPTDKYRNATASVSLQKFSELIFYSRIFLETNNEEFFFRKLIKNYDEIKKLSDTYGTNIIYLEIEGNSNNKDIKNSKALSLFNSFKKWINNYGFKIFNYYYYFDDEKLYGYILYYPEKLPDYEIKEGPLIWERENYDKFYEKHKNEEIFVRNGKIYSISKRKINNMENLIQFLLNNYKESIRKKANKIYIKVKDKEFNINY